MCGGGLALRSVARGPLLVAATVFARPCGRRKSNGILEKDSYAISVERVAKRSCAGKEADAPQDAGKGTARGSVLVVAERVAGRRRRWGTDYREIFLVVLLLPPATRVLHQPTPVHSPHHSQAFYEDRNTLKMSRDSTLSSADSFSMSLGWGLVAPWAPEHLGAIA